MPRPKKTPSARKAKPPKQATPPESKEIDLRALSGDAAAQPTPATPATPATPLNPAILRRRRARRR